MSVVWDGSFIKAPYWPDLHIENSAATVHVCGVNKYSQKGVKIPRKVWEFLERWEHFSRTWTSVWHWSLNLTLTAISCDKKRRSILLTVSRSALINRHGQNKHRKRRFLWILRCSLRWHSLVNVVLQPDLGHLIGSSVWRIW